MRLPLSLMRVFLVCVEARFSTMQRARKLAYLESVYSSVFSRRDTEAGESMPVDGILDAFRGTGRARFTQKHPTRNIELPRAGFRGIYIASG